MNMQSFYRTRNPRESNKKNTAVSLQVNCCGVVSQEKPFSSRGIRRDLYFLYLLEGLLTMPDCTMKPGDVIIIEPEHHYQYKSVENTTYLWIHFTGLDAMHSSIKALGQLNTKRQIGIHPEIKDCFQRLFREFMVNDAHASALSVCLLREILLLTERYADVTKIKDIPLKAIDYLHSHFREEVSITYLAKIEQVSLTSLRCMFHSHTGVSPNTYLIMLRMDAACRMLTQTDIPICDIAAEVGYSDPYYFSRIFKKKIGKSPLRYRKEA